MRVAFLVCTLLLAARVAHANCPDRKASCLLHEEGVEFFVNKNYEEAAKKFAAAIAAEPTARSYLGYAQAVEALGQIALAYDTMVAAQKLSSAELQANPKDADLTARSERIKYKLGELRAKIGFVWLRVPDGVRPQRVVAVRREGEGDLAQPLTQWTAVAPNKQLLIATIDDGTKIEVTAEVAAGSQGVLVIPIQRVATGPGPGPGPGPGRPITQLYVPVPAPPKPTYSAYFAVGLAVTGGPHLEDESFDAPPTSGTGTGFSLQYEKAFGKALGFATRIDYLFHSENENFGTNAGTASGNEILLLVGLRTFGSRSLHGRVGAGLSIYSEQASLTGDFTRAYPEIDIGGGLTLGRARFQFDILFSVGESSDPTIPKMGTRALGTFAIDLWRKANPLPATAQAAPNMPTSGPPPVPQ